MISQPGLYSIPPSLTSCWSQVLDGDCEEGVLPVYLCLCSTQRMRVLVRAHLETCRTWWVWVGWVISLSILKSLLVRGKEKLYPLCQLPLRKSLQVALGGDLETQFSFLFSLTLVFLPLSLILPSSRFHFYLFLILLLSFFLSFFPSFFFPYFQTQIYARIEMRQV